jgi:hypothetical protein
MTPHPTIPNLISTLRLISDEALKRVEPRKTAREYHLNNIVLVTDLLMALAASPEAVVGDVLRGWAK